MEPTRGRYTSPGACSAHQEVRAGWVTEAVASQGGSEALASAPVTPLERVMKEVWLPPDRGHRRSWQTYVDMAPLSTWARDHGTAGNELCIPWTAPCLLWAMTMGSVVLEPQGLLWEGGGKAEEVGAPLPCSALLSWFSCVASFGSHISPTREVLLLPFCRQGYRDQRTEPLNSEGESGSIRVQSLPLGVYTELRG